jgi:hypothetical protein
MFHLMLLSKRVNLQKLAAAFYFTTIIPTNGKSSEHKSPYQFKMSPDPAVKALYSVL